MAQVFEPHYAIHVVASSPHPKNTEYRVASGFEKWNTPVSVTKIQMVYDGKVAGRISPSYPNESLDEKAVDFAKELIKKKYGSASNRSKVVLQLKHVDSTENVEQVIDQTENEIQNMHLDMFRSSSVTPIVDVEFMERYSLGDSIVGLLFRVEISK